MVGSHYSGISGEAIAGLRVEWRGNGKTFYIRDEVLHGPVTPWVMTPPDLREQVTDCIRHIAERPQTRIELWEACEDLGSNESGVDVHARTIPQPCS